MKYIIVKDREDKESGIVFPDSIIHKDVARIHRATDVRLVAAGFCSIGKTCKTWGSSESLRHEFQPRPEDAEILTRDFGGADVGS